MHELDFVPDEYRRAVESKDAAELAELADHDSHYIRARVAGNPATPRAIRDILCEHGKKHTSVLLWLLGNPVCTRDEYIVIYTMYGNRAYDGNVHISLASSHHATESELGVLLRLDKWAVTMAVLNNYHGRDLDQYRTLLKHITLPHDESNWEKWTEVQKLAYFRMTGNRRPSNP